MINLTKTLAIKVSVPGKMKRVQHTVQPMRKDLTIPREGKNWNGGRKC
jgi:hypothetical protein